MLRKDREELVAKCSPGLNSLPREELVMNILELTNYCDELELEISKLCNKCKRCRLTQDGPGYCKSLAEGKPIAEEKSDTNWGSWFG